MMFARGGDMKNKALWGDSSVAFEEVSKYARFATGKNYFESEPVGQLQPNGYGLYDVFGLVWEHVLFEESNPFASLQNHPACLKGGNNRVVREHKIGKVDAEPYWKWINYGYSKANLGGMMAGFRLIRKLN
jgi:formylglycine-generating enzyme required for sulfatase activity